MDAKLTQWRLAFFDARKVYRALGFPNSKIPPFYAAHATVAGFDVQILASARVINARLPADARLSRRAHRVFTTCPRCHKAIPFGRTWQHARRKDHQ